MHNHIKIIIAINYCIIIIFIIELLCKEKIIFCAATVDEFCYFIIDRRTIKDRLEKADKKLQDMRIGRSEVYARLYTFLE